MSEARVRRHPSRGAGYAELRLPGAAAAAPDARFRLFWESHHNPYLGPNGWQAAVATLHPEEAAAEGRDLVLTLGPEVCEHLESDTYEVVLPALGEARFVVPWVEIPHRPWQGRATVFGRAPPRPPTPPPLKTTPRQPPPPEDQVPPHPPPPEPPPSPPEPPPGPGDCPGATAGEERPPPKPKPLWPWLAGLLPLLAAAIVVWSLLGPAPGPERSVPPNPPSPSHACAGQQGMPGAQQAAREIVNRAGCQPADYVPIAMAMREAGRHDDALLLLEEAAERGVTRAMGLLARMYDPEGFQRGRPFDEPDPRQAARWYRAAERAGDFSITGARAALRAALQSRAQQGDTMAGLTLEDFWP